MWQPNLLRQVQFYGTYYPDFYEKLDVSVRAKLDWTLILIETQEKVPRKYFRAITDSTGLYEIRIQSAGKNYRVFSFFDKGKLIVLINGFQKKSRKTPKTEIAKAVAIKKQYFNEKYRK